MECVFCEIAAKRIPARIITESRHSVVFMDIRPLTPGHSLAIPKAHHSRMQDMDPEECADLFETVRTTIAKTDELTGATLLAVHNGEQSGQEVPHVHVHLVPRSSADGAGAIHSMFSDAPPVSKAESDAAYKKLE